MIYFTIKCNRKGLLLENSCLVQK